MSIPTLRIARPTLQLRPIVDMYVSGLGMAELGGFENHDGYDGAMVGYPQGPYHLEFTHEHGAESEPAPSAEHMLVIYEPDPDGWARRCESMTKAGFVPVAAQNPYWEREGRTFRDLDGYLVVVCRREWRL